MRDLRLFGVPVGNDACAALVIAGIGLRHTADLHVVPGELGVGRIQ